MLLLLMGPFSTTTTITRRGRRRRRWRTPLLPPPPPPPAYGGGRGKWAHHTGPAAAAAAAPRAAAKARALGAGAWPVLAARRLRLGVRLSLAEAAFWQSPQRPEALALPSASGDWRRRHWAAGRGRGRGRGFQAIVGAAHAGGGDPQAAAAGLAQLAGGLDVRLTDAGIRAAIAVLQSGVAPPAAAAGLGAGVGLPGVVLDAAGGVGAQLAAAVAGAGAVAGGAPGLGVPVMAPAPAAGADPTGLAAIAGGLAPGVLSAAAAGAQDSQWLGKGLAPATVAQLGLRAGSVLETPTYAVDGTVDGTALLKVSMT